MSCFSISRVAQYARYHYATQRKHYLAIILQMLGWPLLFGILSRDIDTVYGIGLALYIFGAMGYSIRTTWSMRGRSTKVLESVIPISNEERMTFMILNGVVAFPLILTITTTLAMLLTTPFVYADVAVGHELCDMITHGYFYWPIYILIQIIYSASLLINLAARRNLVLAYVGAFIGVMVFFGITGRIGLELIIRYEEQFSAFSQLSIPEPVGITLYVLIPVVFYVLGYLVLRKRQVKW